MANQIKFNINFDVDKSGLNELQRSLQNIQNMTEGELMNINKGMGLPEAATQLGQVKETAQQVGTILQNSFNQDLGTLNVSKFNEQLKGLDLNKVYEQFSSIGTAGQSAFKQMTAQILTTNTQLKESHTLLDDMATTMANTVKWGVASSAMNKLTGSVQEAYGYVKNLDTSLNNIRIVTEKSSDDMAAFAKSANDAAKALGASTTDYTNASLIYYQQGLSDEEAAARTEVTLKTANVTGQAAKEVSEQLTAVWNGYQVTSEEAESSIDMLAAVAANTASNLEELSTGMSKVASAANAMGVSEEQLTAQLSTIISATREAPESVGTALRTIYARMSTIATGGVDEDDGATLTSYTEKMANFGISVLDVNGQLRDMGDVVEEIGGKWDTFTREQQVSLAQTMAGTRQYNYALSLFENWDEYTRALNVAENSVGTLQTQQDIYMESTAAHLEQMNTSFEDLYDSLLGSDAINSIVDVISAAASGMADFVDAIGGGSGVLLNLGSIGVSVFSQQIAGSIATTISNLQKAKENTEQLQAEWEITQQYENTGIKDEDIQRLVDMKQQMLDLDKYATESDRQQGNAIIQQTANLMEQRDVWNDQVDSAKQYVKTIQEAAKITVKNDNGAYDYSEAIKGIKDYQEELKEANSELSKNTKTIDDYRQKTATLVNTQKENADATDKVATAQTNQRDSAKILEDTMTELCNKFEAQNSAMDTDCGSYKMLQQAIVEYQKTVEKGVSGEELAAAAENVIAAYKEMNRTMIDEGTEAVHTFEKESKDALNEIEKKISTTEQAFSSVFGEHGKLDLTKTITEFTNLIGAVGRTASAINTLNNVFDVWEDQDLGTTEKITQTIMGLASALPMAISGITDLSKAISGILGVSSGAVTAIIIGLGAAIVGISQVMGNYQTDLEKAATTAEDLAQANDDVAESLTNIKNNIDTYDSAVAALEDCTQGTEEWKSALEDVNEAAINVINSLSGLSGDELRELSEGYDSNGQLQINTDVLNDYVEQLESQANAMEFASGFAEYQESMAQVTEDYKSISSTLDMFAANVDGVSNAEAAAAKILEADTEVQLEKLAEKAGMSVTELEYARSKLQDCAESADGASAKLDLIAGLTIGGASEEDYGEFAGAVAAMTTKDIEAETETRSNELLEGVKGLSRWANSDADAYQAILKSLPDNYSAGSNPVQGGPNNRQLSFYNADTGDDETHNAAYWANIVAANQANDNAEQYNKDNAKILQDAVDKAGLEVVGAIDDYMAAGNFGDITPSQVAELSSQIENQYGHAGAEKTERYLEGLGLSDYIDTDAFIEGINDINTSFEHVADNLRTTAQEAFKAIGNTGAFDDLSFNTQASIANVLESSLDYGGQAALGAVTTIFTSLDGGFEEFANVASEFDGVWGEVSYEEFIAALEESGFEGEITADKLQAYIDAMNSAGEASEKTAEAVRASYKTVQDITDGLEYRSTITAEDYQTLLEEGMTGLEKYFTYMNDGTYMLTTSAEKFAEEVQQFQIGNIREAEAGNDQTISNLQGLQNSVGDSFDLYTQPAPLNETSALPKSSQNTFDTETASEQIEILRELSDVEENVISEWEEQVQAGTATMDTYQDIADAVANCKDAYDNIDTTIAQLHGDNVQWEIGIMETAGSLSELHEMLNSGLIPSLKESTIATEAYNTVAAEMYEASRVENLDSDAIKDYAKYLQNICKESDELADSLDEDDDAAYNLAISIMRMNDGVETLADNWENWSDILENSSSTSYEYFEALENTKTALADLLDTQEDYISDTTIIEHMDDIALAAQGDADAIDRLREASYEDIKVQIFADEETFTDFSDRLDAIKDKLDNEDWSMHPSIDLTAFEDGAENYIDDLNELIDDAELTTDQVQAAMADMGYNVTFQPGTEEVTSYYPVTTIEHHREYGEPDENGNYTDWVDTETVLDQHNVDAQQLSETLGVEVDTEKYSGGGTIETKSAKVASISKKPSGSANNYSSKNSGGKSLVPEKEETKEKETKSSTPKSSKSSTPKSTKSSTPKSTTTKEKEEEEKEPAHEDLLESEADRYHDIDLQLKSISTDLSRIQKQTDKLYGQKLIDNLNSQLATLNSQIDATNAKIDIAEKEAAEYRKTLSGQGVLFDEAGYITNYDAVMEKQLEYVNSVITKYNKMSADEQEAYQDTLDQAKQDYEDFVDLITDYDNLISDTIPDLEDSISDAVNQKIELEIEKFTMEVEIRLEMTEAEQDWNQFYRKVILGISDDDALGNAMQDLADLMSYVNTGAADMLTGTGDSLEGWYDKIMEAIASGEGTGSLQTLTKQVNETVEQLNQIQTTGTSSVYGDDEASAREDLISYYTELMTELEAIEDLSDDIMDRYLDKIDEAVEAFDEQVSQYEYINDLYNHDMNLISLLYGDDAYEEMSRYYEKIEENNNQELDFLRQRVDYAYEMMQAETDDEARKKWQDEWENALSELNSKVEDSVQNIIDKYSNAIAQIIDELNKEVTNGLGLDYVNEEWDLMNQVSDMYLDTINAEYEIQSLESKYNKAISSTDSISAQKKLNEMMEEQINYLREKENLTQYDVDRANMVYEITLKQLALEEAQQNKSTLRLRRDAQGNYSYQYVSDEDEIQTLQDELAALENQLYNFDKQAYTDNLNQILSIYEEFQQKILDLYQDQTLSAEEREARIAMYVEYYGELANGYVEENGYIRENLTQSTINSLANLYGTDVANFENMTDEEIDDLMTNLIPQWDSSVQHMADTFAGDGGMIETCSDALDKLDDANDVYTDDLDKLQKAAGVCFDNVAEGYDDSADEAKKLLSKNDELINAYGDEIEEIKKVISALNDWRDAYKEVTDAAKEAAKTGYKAAQDEAEAAAKAAEEVKNAKEEEQKAADDKTDDKKDDKTDDKKDDKTDDKTETTQGNGKIEVGDKVLFNSGKYYEDSSGGGNSGSKYRGSGTYLYVTKINSSGSHPYHLSTKNVAPSNPANNYQLGWVKKSQISGYDTGGYTGDWSGDNGALAVLHQKEIVLNSEDTKNLLSAVNIVRDVATMLDDLNTSVLNKVSNLITGLSQVTLQHSSQDEVLEQNVHIEANFPNVTNSTEIENAFNNLVNIASMHAYSTR